MYDAMQLWRGENNVTDYGPPVSYYEWLETLDNDTPLTGFEGGWGWRAQVAGLSRQYDEENSTYTDVSSDPPVALVCTRFGISFIIDIDGFRAFKKGSYSVNGVYIAINNLPFYLRNRPENILTVMVTPGPNKPNAYECDQMLEPLVNDLIALARGVHMCVYQTALGRAERELVHGHLHAMALDYIARVESCGHAALATEVNFCLYCKMQRLWVSIPQGFNVDSYDIRDPFQYLQHKYQWLNRPNQRNQLFRQNGTRFTVLDRMPGFYGNTSCPIDGMHMFSTGTTQWLIKQLIVGPGMLGARYANQPEDEHPSARFDRGLSNVILPSFCSWIPPRLSNLTTRMKSEQWLHIVPLLPVLLYDAYRVGDTVPDGLIPRGAKNLVTYKHQQRTAKIMLRYKKRIHRGRNDPNEPVPTINDCAASREVRPLLKNCIRYCVSHSILHNNSITPTLARFATDLFSRCASTFARMNYHLSPNFHIGTHIESFLHKYGCLRNTWCFPFERLNKIMINTNHNGHGLGTLETTMLRGYLKKAECIRLLRQMQEIPETTDDDDATIEMILDSIRTGPESEMYRGMLAEVLAGEAHFQTQERCQLASNPAKVADLYEVPEHWDLICGHITSQLGNFIVYARGRRPERGIHLSSKGSTLSYSHLLRSGIRFGVAGHAHGNNSRFGFIHDNIPVIIRRIYKSVIRFPGEGNPCEYVVVLVQRFKRHATYPDPRFPWRRWNESLRIEAWAEDEYEGLEAVGPRDLTGTFAVYPITLSRAAYWLTIAMKPVVPEHLE